jgi:hypothetical protein
MASLPLFVASARSGVSNVGEIGGDRSLHFGGFRCGAAERQAKDRGGEYGEFHLHNRHFSSLFSFVIKYLYAILKNFYKFIDHTIAHIAQLGRVNPPAIAQLGTDLFSITDQHRWRVVVCSRQFIYPLFSSAQGIHHP